MTDEVYTDAQPVSETGPYQPRLSKRTDLNNAVGVIVTLPTHGENQAGRMAWGAHSDYGVHAEEFYDKFSEEMEAAVENAIDSIPSAPPLVRTKPSHLYETGPDAQTWPQVALMLWEDIQPYLQNIEMLVSLGLAVNLVKQRIRDWHNDKNQEIAEQYAAHSRLAQ